VQNGFGFGFAEELGWSWEWEWSEACWTLEGAARGPGPVKELEDVGPEEQEGIGTDGDTTTVHGFCVLERVKPGDVSTSPWSPPTSIHDPVPITPVPLG